MLTGGDEIPSIPPVAPPMLVTASPGLLTTPLWLGLRRPSFYQRYLLTSDGALLICDGAPLTRHGGSLIGDGVPRQVMARL